MWYLVPSPGIEPGPSASGAWSLSQWTIREVLVRWLLRCLPYNESSNVAGSFHYPMLPCCMPRRVPILLVLERGGMGLMPSFYLLTLNWNLFLNLQHMVLWFSVESRWTGGDLKGTHTAITSDFLLSAKSLLFASSSSLNTAFWLFSWFLSVAWRTDSAYPLLTSQFWNPSLSTRCLGAWFWHSLSTFFHTTSTRAHTHTHTHTHTHMHSSGNW